MTLDDVKEVRPDATEVPKDTYILQDINGNDLIITSDMIENMVQMQLIICANGGGVTMKTVASVESYFQKQYSNGKSFAGLSYDLPSGFGIIVKISDVDNWYDV